MKQLIYIIVLIIVISCSSNPNTNGYWREYDPKHPDTYHVFQLTDSSIMVDPVIWKMEIEKNYKKRKFEIPFNNLNNWSFDYNVDGDTILSKDKFKWIKYNYNDSLFIQDISGPCMLKFVPEFTTKGTEYLEIEQSNAALLYIGSLKDSYKEILLNDSNQNLKYPYIQFNDKLGTIGEIRSFAINSDKLILLMDKNVPPIYLDSIMEVQKQIKKFEVYKTYIDLQKRKLVIKKI
jgi:hypothetical protein